MVSCFFTVQVLAQLESFALKDFSCGLECGTFSLSLSLEHGSVEQGKMLFGVVGLIILSPWIYIVRWCTVRRGRRICSCGVSPSVLATKLRCAS